nr:hypothetical transcript [Hymenolepis microstoma]
MISPINSARVDLEISYLLRDWNVKACLEESVAQTEAVNKNQFVKYVIMILHLIEYGDGLILIDPKQDTKTLRFIHES